MGNSQPKGFTSKSQRLPPLPVKVMLKNVSYEYDVRTGKWRQGEGLQDLRQSANKNTPAYLAALEKQIQQAQDELEQSKQNNEDTKKKIADRKTRTKELEEITIAEAVEVERLKKYRDKISTIKTQNPDAFKEEALGHH